MKTYSEFFESISYTSITEPMVKHFADEMGKFLKSLNFSFERQDSGSRAGKSVYFTSPYFSLPMRVSAHSKGAKNHAIHWNIESKEAFDKAKRDIQEFAKTIPAQKVEVVVPIDNSNRYTMKTFENRVKQALKGVTDKTHKDVKLAYELYQKFGNMHDAFEAYKKIKMNENV